MATKQMRSKRRSSADNINQQPSRRGSAIREAKREPRRGKAPTLASGRPRSAASLGPLLFAIMVAALLCVQLSHWPLVQSTVINIWKHRYPFYGGYGGHYYPYWGGYGYAGYGGYGRR